MYYDESRQMHYKPVEINNKIKDGTVRGFFGYDYRELQIDPDWHPDESKSVSMVMQPGQFVLFWSTLMHASHPHSGKTKNMRLGYVARYVPTSVRIYPNTEFLTEYGGTVSLEQYGAVLVAGKNNFGHNRIRLYTTREKPFNCQI